MNFFAKAVIIRHQVHLLRRTSAQTFSEFSYFPNNVVASKIYKGALCHSAFKAGGAGNRLSQADAVCHRRRYTHWLLEAYGSRIEAVCTSIVMIRKTCEGQNKPDANRFRTCFRIAAVGTNHGCVSQNIRTCQAKQKYSRFDLWGCCFSASTTRQKMSCKRVNKTCHTSLISSAYVPA